MEETMKKLTILLLLTLSTSSFAQDFTTDIFPWFLRGAQAIGAVVNGPRLLARNARIASINSTAPKTAKYFCNPVIDNDGKKYSFKTKLTVSKGGTTDIVWVKDTLYNEVKEDLIEWNSIHSNTVFKDIPEDMDLGDIRYLRLQFRHRENDSDIKWNAVDLSNNNAAHALEIYDHDLTALKNIKFNSVKPWSSKKKKIKANLNCFRISKK